MIHYRFAVLAGICFAGFAYSVYRAMKYGHDPFSWEGLAALIFLSAGPFFIYLQQVVR